METLQDWIGQLVRQAREECGYSQQYVADEIDIDIRTLKKIENGQTDTDFITISKLIRLLNISPNIMFHANQDETGLKMDKVYRELLQFTPEQITMIYDSAIHVRSWYVVHEEEYREFRETYGLC